MRLIVRCLEQTHVRFRTWLELVWNTLQEQTNDTEGTIDTRKYESWFTFQAGTLKRGEQRKIEREREFGADVFLGGMYISDVWYLFSFRLLLTSFKQVFKPLDFWTFTRLHRL